MVAQSSKVVISLERDVCDIAYPRHLAPYEALEQLSSVKKRRKTLVTRRNMHIISDFLRRPAAQSCPHKEQLAVARRELQRETLACTQAEQRRAADIIWMTEAVTYVINLARGIARETELDFEAMDCSPDFGVFKIRLTPMGAVIVVNLNEDSTEGPSINLIIDPRSGGRRTHKLSPEVEIGMVLPGIVKLLLWEPTTN